MHEETPLSGGSFRSSFGEKFRISPDFDKAGEHEWSLLFDDGSKFEIESISRGKGKGFRFWQKGKRGAGDGYLDWPVIFLSLKRLIPLAETKADRADYVLSKDEQEFYFKSKNHIFDCIGEVNKGVTIIEGASKSSLGLDTDKYDWRQNSAGQDNIGKIIAAIISFKRLKDKYKNYKGGILVIDEIDATLHPVAQEKLFDFLLRQGKNLNLQIIVTTHSLSLLKYVCSKMVQFVGSESDVIRILLLDKKNGEIGIKSEGNFSFLKNRLLLTADIPARQKLKILTEDDEARQIVSVINRKIKLPLDLMKGALGCDQYLQMVENKVELLLNPEILLVLDGDVAADSKKAKIIKCRNNILTLPGKESPERELARALLIEDDDSLIWSKVAKNYTKEVCFRNFTFDDILNDRQIAKKWFKEQKISYKSWLTVAVGCWRTQNAVEFSRFEGAVKNYYNSIFLKYVWNEKG